MSTRRRICVVTGTRAEYGLLYWLLREIAADPALELQLAVTGMHLAPEFGATVSDIERDGFAVDARVEMLLSSDSAVGIAKSMGVGTMGFADAFARLRPDIVVVLGDRFEILAAAQAALVARIPIAHLHGGEITEGAFDESVRHAVTKLSHYHFVAAEPYRKRVVQLGEDPARVFNVGAPGLEYLSKVDWMGRDDLVRSLGVQLAAPTFLVTYHPTTLGALRPAEAMAEVLGALDEFPEATVVISYPNADTGGRGLIRQIDQWVAAHADRATALASLGQRRYLSLMRLADAVVGNSSSGLTEAPALKRATVNIGDRQGGRLKATSVIDATEDRTAIAGALRRALSAEFRTTLRSTESLYGTGDVSRRIKEILKSVLLEARKSFFNIEHEY